MKTCKHGKKYSVHQVTVYWFFIQSVVSPVFTCPLVHYDKYGVYDMNIIDSFGALREPQENISRWTFAKHTLHTAL